MYFTEYVVLQIILSIKPKKDWHYSKKTQDPLSQTIHLDLIVIDNE